MKRFLLLIVLVMLVFWIMARHRAAHIRPAGSAQGTVRVTCITAMRVRQRARLAAVRRHAVDEQTRQALHEARAEVRQAFDEAQDEVRQASDEVRKATRSQTTIHPMLLPPAPQPPTSAREEAEGLPVPIVPGTRVSEAQAQPPVPPRP